MRTKKSKTASRRAPQHTAHDLDDSSFDQMNNEKKVVLAISLVLFLFGVYQSILFYGHQIVPNSDFSAFYNVGKSILSFKLPGSFKRVPVTGMLQCLLTPLMSGHYADLKAGWLLNAILHPFNGVLLFLLARELLGRSAKWFALICMINPWVLYLMLEPIAETTLLFFILLTIYVMFRRSKWCYLAAAIATMVRYECAALILAAFVIDMIQGKSRKERLTAFGLSALACIPLGLWMIGTMAHKGGEPTHYLNVFKASSSSAFSKLNKDRIGIIKHLGLIWSVGYSNLFSLRMGATQDATASLALVNRILAGFTFLLGAGFAVYRKSWKILILGIFLVPYFLIHAYYPYPIPRFHMPSFWIVLLISIYGIKEGLGIIAQNKTIANILIVLQLMLVIIFVFWFFNIVPNLSRCGQVCPKAISMPWVAIGAVVLLGGVTLYFHKFKGFLTEICLVSMLLVVIVSNQLPVAWLINDGSRDSEFKQLADWYMENAEPGEGLATTLPSVVRIYLSPEMKRGLVNYRNIKGKNMLEFAQKLEKQNVVYVAWDSRLGLAPQDPYYTLYNLEKIKSLMYPKSQGPYKFVKQLRNGKRFINIFRLENVNQYHINEPAESPGK